MRTVSGSSVLLPLSTAMRCSANSRDLCAPLERKTREKSALWSQSVGKVQITITFETESTKTIAGIACKVQALAF